VVRSLEAGVAEPLHRLGEPPVKLAPAHPRHLGIERLLRERVAESDLARPGLLDQAALGQLCQRRLAGNALTQAEIEMGAGHGRRLGSLARFLGEVRDADEDGFADRVRDGDLVVIGQLEPARSGRHSAPCAQGRNELLDEEGRAQGALIDHPHQRRRGRLR
jgi:hypothetical protein